MWEDKQNSLCVHLEGLRPISGVTDLLCHFCGTIFELYASNEFDLSVITGDSVHSQKDMVKIDY